MPLYEFQGRTKSGEPIKGKRESDSADHLAEQLLSEEIFPLQIKQTKNDTDISFLQKISHWADQISVDDMLMFCRQMYTLHNAGVPIIFALNRMSEVVQKKRFKIALSNMAETISAGKNLATAMQQQSDIFPEMLIQLVHIGEESGKLDQAFLQAGNYLELQSTTVRRIKTVLRYPLFVLSAIMIAVIVINLFVIPTFAKLYSNFHAQLPLPTRILLGISSFMVHYWHYLLMGAILVIFFTYRYLKTKEGRYKWDKLQFKLPIIGSIIEHIIFSRFVNLFAVIIRAGVPLSTGIVLVANAVGNTYAQQTISAMGVAIERGENLTNAAVAAKIFSPLVLQMLAVGEETGEVEAMLEEIGKFYEREVDYELKRLADRIEPILLIALAAMVLILALGVFLPMWNMASLIKHT